MSDWHDNYNYYISRGRCPRCGGKRALAPGRKQCAECAEKHRIFQREQRNERRENRLCIRCGRPLAEDDKTMCGVCRDKINRSRRAKSKADKKRYHVLKAAGKCVICGARWAEQAEIQDIEKDRARGAGGEKTMRVECIYWSQERERIAREHYNQTGARSSCIVT